MNYCYDIMLNFQENNYMFYDWCESDSIELICKIPIFQVTTKTLKDMINNNVKVNKEFLDTILNKTKTKKNTLESVALFASKNGAIALEFAGDGKVIARSFLQVDDECHVLEIIYTIPILKLDYEILEKQEYNKDLRCEKIIKDFISLEINTLYNNKDLEKIVFLYNEWFFKNKKNVGEMITEMQEKLKNRLTEDEIRIYNLIKLSYNNV